MHDRPVKMGRRAFMLVPATILCVHRLALGVQSAMSRAASGRLPAIAYLVEVMDGFHRTLDVYTDSHAAGNHFVARARMSSPGDEDAVAPMNEASTTNPHSGATCIEATFRSRGLNWGGWYLMNGVLEGDERSPRPNWGEVALAGVDLRGATTLEWWARGHTGGERVSFFALGVGHDPGGGDATAMYPDSAPRVSRTVTLSTAWQRFELDLRRADLRYALGGFGWTVSAPTNANGDITFYIDDVRYNKSALDEARLLVSYDTTRSNDEFDTIMRNVAYTYDNAIALIALLAAGERDRARLIAEAFIYAQRHDPVYRDGRLRNAYQGGTLIVPPGWRPNGTPEAVRLPGWYDSASRQWLEDSQQVGSNVGNMAWAILALSAYAEAADDSRALRAAVDLGTWVEKNCRDTRGDGGYRAGFEGWPANLLRLEYKVTEHAIDLYAAFRRLYRLTNDAAWRERSDHAKRFLLSMWDEKDGKFWTGTGNDGVTPNYEVIPVDVQAWAILALKGEGEQYWRALDYAEKHLATGAGFDFNQDKDGTWYEGTAIMAAAYRFIGDTRRTQEHLNVLRSTQVSSGALPAASKDGLTTGFFLPDGRPWLYFKRPHVAATAWAAIAEVGVNPLA